MISIIIAGILTALLLCSCDNAPKAQDIVQSTATEIVLDSISAPECESLYRLGLVWGFLKYHHPAVIKGNYDWDAELFKIMPAYLDAEASANQDSILLAWINSLGKIKPSCKNATCSGDRETVKMAPDLAWLTETGFSQPLVDKLQEVLNAKRPAKQYYAESARGVNNPVFLHEKLYETMDYPDDAYRILALYRYWNMVEYFYPYRYLIADWHHCLKEYIPVMINAQNQEECTLGLLRLIARIRDTHANIYRNSALNEYMGQFYSSARIAIINERCYITDFYNDIHQGLETGDEVISVNGKSTAKMIEELLPVTPASNYPTQLRNISLRILRSRDSLMSIEYIHEGQLCQSEIQLFRQEDLTNYYYYYKMADSTFRMVTDNIALIDNGHLKKNEIPAIKEKLKGTKGLILDLRNYPSDFPIFALCEALFPHSAQFVKFGIISPSAPGMSTYSKYDLSAGKNDNKDPYTGKIVILVNEAT